MAGLLAISGAVRKNVCRTEIFLRRKPHSRVWGRHSPTSFPRGAKPQNCGFWHRGRNLLLVSRRLPLSGFSVHRTDRTGLPARCGRPFFFPLKIHLQRPLCYPLDGDFSKFLLPLVIRATGFWQPAGQRIFPFTPYNTSNVENCRTNTGQFSLCFLIRTKFQKCQIDNKKSSKSFSDLLLSLAAGGGWYSVLKVRVKLAPMMEVQKFTDLLFQ